MMGFTDLGQVKKGFEADLLVTNSNPLDNIYLLAKTDRYRNVPYIKAAPASEIADNETRICP